MALDAALPAGLARVTFPAMGTTVAVLLPEADAPRGGEAVRALFEEWEAALSRFRPESELSRLNARAGQPVAVSPLLFEVLTRALEAARATGGLYDPTLLRQMVYAGYDRTFSELSPSSSVPVPSPLIVSGGAWRMIQLDQRNRRVTLPAGEGLDFGGIAKGMAVDAALERLRALGIASALVNAGGDLAVMGLPPASDAWPIAVPGRRASWILPLRRGAVATSGIERRRWRQGALQRHHLLDPRTGEPVAGELWSVTVVAGRCQQAEVAAKVAFILGPEAGARWLADRDLAGVLVHADGRYQSAGRWPHDLQETTP